MPVKALPPEALYTRCAPETLPFETTEGLEPLNALFGQSRAMEAIRFGTRIPHRGYNMYALGSRESGHRETVRAVLEQVAAEEPVPADWVYVTRFDDPSSPRALSLKAGEGGRLRDLVDHAMHGLKAGLPAVFLSEQYAARRKALDESFQQRYSDALAALETEARKIGITIITSDNGLTIAPVADDGEVMTGEQYHALSDTERAAIDARINQVHEAIEEVSRTRIPHWEAERADTIEKLNQEFAEVVVAHFVGDVKKEFTHNGPVTAWLDDLSADVLRELHVFAPDASGEGGAGGEAMLLESLMGPSDPFSRYQVNLAVDHAKSTGAPVIELDHPTLAHLVGRVDGAMEGPGSHAALVRVGALQKANGGYLMIDARKVLDDWTAWEALKRALLRDQLTVETYADASGYYEAQTVVPMTPEPIPAALKVVLYGPSWLYHALVAREPEFSSLFKVQVEFSSWIERSGESDLLFARVLGSMARDNSLRPLDRSGVARLIEQAARMADDAQRLALAMEPLRDLMSEADFHASEEGAKLITASHVDAALAAQADRADMWRENQLTRITNDDKLISSDGERVGQINGLVVHSLPSFRWGSVARITARVRAGGGKVIDIERSVGFGRQIYAKGAEIMGAWLLATFGADRPLNFAASIVFEQSYGPIDGDSASSTELYALLSALADAPIAQNLAVTGSVNQFGEVQVIGGVNEKIEGFFDLCSVRGLTGDQGVLIPVQNVRDLMLRADIVEAAKAGRFHIYPIATIAEGIERLTGVPAGAPDGKGGYEPDTIFDRVQRRLYALSGYRVDPEGEDHGPGPEPKRKRWLF